MSAYVDLRIKVFSKFLCGAEEREPMGGISVGPIVSCVSQRQSMPAVEKTKAEAVIRSLLPQWRTEAGLDHTDPLDLSFTDFWNWMKENHYSYTQFKSRMGAEEDAERWFDQAFGLIWTR